jgi:hypothetical protein
MVADHQRGDEYKLSYCQLFVAPFLQLKKIRIFWGKKIVNRKQRAIEEVQYWRDILSLHAGCADEKTLNYFSRVIGVTLTNAPLSGDLMLQASMDKGEAEKFLITAYSCEKNKKQRECMGY